MPKKVGVQIPVRGFKELGAMTLYLSDFLRDGFGVSFHNQGGFYLIDTNGQVVYEMNYSGDAKAEMGRTFPFAHPFFKPSRLKDCSPFFEKNKKIHPDQDVASIGPEGTVWGIKRGAYQDICLDSKDYGPRIMAVELVEANWYEPQFRFTDKERVFWDKSVQ